MTSPRTRDELAHLAFVAERSMRNDRALHDEVLSLFRDEAKTLGADDLVQRFDACIAHSREHYGKGVTQLGQRPSE